MGPGGRGSTSSLLYTEMQRLDPAQRAAPSTPSSVSAAAAARQSRLSQVCTQLGSDQTGARRRPCVCVLRGQRRWVRDAGWFAASAGQRTQGERSGTD